MKNGNIQIEEGVPKHFANYLVASHDLESLQVAHGEWIFKKYPDQSRIPDEESVFLKAGITLLCATWEAYVEDLARNSVEHLIINCKEPNQLPKAILQNISKEVKSDKNELSAWDLSGDSWKQYTIDRFERLIMAKANHLNTPNSANIKDLYFSTMGIEDITSCWTWEYFEAAVVRKIVDDLVKERGAVAHGRKTHSTIHIMVLVYYSKLVSECAVRMNNFMLEHLKQITGIQPWNYLQSGTNWELFTNKRSTTDD